MSVQHAPARGTTAFCTIVSKNYFAYARTLVSSHVRANGQGDFYVLIVDRADERERYTCPGARVLFLEDLRIPDWRKHAFKFDIVELNTNVKPSLLKHLLSEGYSRAYYFDPDISIYGPTAVLDETLDRGNIILTPHALSPSPEDGRRLVDRDFLRCGVYNLGFIGVRNTDEARRFLDWWEVRCLGQGFNEPALGLFVDQHWLDLAPCFFAGCEILKHPGCNMAYWNLHERRLREVDGRLSVVSSSGTFELVFFHFSGVDASNPEAISKHQNRFTLAARLDLEPLFRDYVARLLENGHEQYRLEAYGFGAFANGAPICSLLRRYYAELPALAAEPDPFDVSSRTFRFAKRHRLIPPRGAPESRLPNSLTLDERTERELHLAGRGLRFVLALLGPARFARLSKFMRHYGIVTNQARILWRSRDSGP